MKPYSVRLLSSLIGVGLAVAVSAAVPAQQDQVLDLGRGLAAKADVTATALADRDHVSVIELAGDYSRELADGSFNAAPRQAVARAFYESHADDYDFLIVFTTFEFDSAGAKAFHLGVANDVLGLGLPVFDNSDFYGSGGRLASYVEMAALTRHELDPLKDGFEETLGVLAHEMMHRWAARVEGSLGDLMLASDGVHWSFFLDSGASLMYGNDWQENADGTFTSVGAFKFFSPLDLYLAGFYAPEEVPPFFVIQGPEADRDRHFELGATVDAPAVPLSIDDVIAVNGPRVPPAGEAPHDFRAAFVLVTRPGEQVSDTAIAGLERLRREILVRFPILTGGRAVLEVFPQVTSETGTGAPGPVAGGDPRAGAASLADALAWLRSRQSAEGYWQDTAATRPRDTVDALEVLSAFDTAFAGAAPALAWLAAADDANTDFLARAVSTLERFGTAAGDRAARLAATQNADGGWGLGPSYASDPLDTALAALALHGRADVAAGVAAGAVQYLLAAQNADGGWGLHAGGASRTGVTTVVLGALTAAGELPAERLATAAAFLASRQNADGGFGDSPSTAHDTADVLLTLLAADATATVDETAAAGYLETRQTEEGSWEGSVHTTARAVEALKRVARRPNWRAGVLAADPAAPRDGERVRLTLAIDNDAAGAAPAGLVRFFDGDPAGGGTLVDEVALPALAAHERAAVTARWETLDLPGSHTLVAVLDPDDEVDESSETDNRATVTVEVAPAPDGVDLTVGAADVAVFPAAPDALPADLAFTAVVRNVGKTDAGTVRVVLWQGEPGTGAPIGETDVVLAARSSVAANFTALLTAPGTTLFTVELDPEGVVAEDDETNNRAAVAVTTRPSLDLEVADQDLELVDGAAFLGFDALFRVTVRNRGTLDALTTAVRVEVTDGVTVTPVQDVTVSLGPGETRLLEIPWRVDRLGVLELVVTVDPENVVLEADESNNTARLAFTAGELVGFNLAVDAAELAFSPDPALQGAPVTVSAVIRNDSGAELRDVEVVFFDGDPQAGGTPLGPAQTLAPLPARGTATATAELAPLAGAASRLIFVVVDPGDLVAELDEDDNVAFRTLQVLTLPDLAVSGSAITVTPAAPRPGEAVAVSAAVANFGEQRADNVLLRLTDSVSTQVLEAVVPAVAAGGSAAASFTWTFPPAGGTVALRLVADPDDAVAEIRESNNAAERFVQPAGREGELVSYRYFSPDGDGVKDTTTFFLGLAAPAEVVVEAVDELDRVRRRAPQGAGVVDVAFEWDGRDDGGQVVADGDYRLRAVDAQGGVLAVALVTVDTNRLPLLEALGTPFQRVTDVTCGVALERDKHNFDLPFPYDQGYFTVMGDPVLGTGAYAVPLGGEPRRILSSPFALGRMVVSDDGEKIAMLGNTALFADTDGSHQGSFVAGIDGHIGFRPGTHELVVGEVGQIRILPLDGGPERVIEHGNFIVGPTLKGLDSRPFFNTFSPDGSRVYLSPIDTFAIEEIANFESGTSGSWITFLDNSQRVAWSPDGSSIAFAGLLPFVGSEKQGGLVVDRPTGSKPDVVFPNEGMAEIDAYAAFGVPSANIVHVLEVSPPSWSSDGRQVLAYASYWERGDTHTATFGRLFAFDVATKSLRTIAFTEPVVAANSFAVSTWDGSAWVERGRLHYGNHYAERSLDLSEHLPDADGEYKVRIRQSGRDAAHVERVLLRFGTPGDAAELRPATATLLGSGADVRELVARHDRDVLDLHEKAMELMFTVDGERLSEGPVELLLAAREEDFSTLDTRPFRYPATPDRGYEVTLDGRGGLLVDGRQTGGDALGEAVFAEYSQPGTGHPSAMVYGYATSDGESLYGALDFTVDNTQDGERDWAALWVRTGDGWRRHRVNVTDSTWGRVGFVRTGKAHHRHKYYEIKVPLAGLGAAVGDTVEIAFEAYGTAALVDGGPGFLPDGAPYPAWVPGTHQVLYTQEFAGSNWILDVDRGTARRVLEEFGSVGEARFVDGGRKLVFRDGRDILDPQSPCYNTEGEFSFFLLESAANLTARLAVAPAAGGNGFDLKGTAADLYLESWILEYADEDVPGFWTPILPAQDHQVLDGLLATWTPPGSGFFRVRLTVRDRAGNTATSTRRLAAGASGSASLTNVSVSPRYISPNGDGERDAATLRYTVLAPANLEIVVRNARGERVRTFERSHSEAGLAHELAWDGRDDAGVPVADGDYRIEVLSFKLPLTVDTRPPTGVIRQTSARGQEDGFIAVAPALEWCAGEPGLLEVAIETGEGDAPQVWTAIASQATVCGDDEPSSRPLDVGDLFGRRYRLRLRDAAGNQAAVQAAPAEPELVLLLLAIDGGPFRRLSAASPVVNGLEQSPSSLAFRLAALTGEPLQSVAVQYRLSSFDPWLERPLPVYEPGGATPLPVVPQPELEARWEGVDLGFGTWQVRIVARGNGGELASNVIFLANDVGLINGGELELADLDGLYAADLAAALESAGLDPLASSVLWVVNPRVEPVADVALLVDSDDDPRFAGGRVLLPAAKEGAVFVFDAADLAPCHRYLTRASGREAATGRVLSSNTVALDRPCLALEVRVDRARPASCDEAADGRNPAATVAVTLVPRRLEGAALQLVTLALDDPLDVVFNVNQPVDGLAYRFEIDTAELAERHHRLYARLVNAAGEEVTPVATLTVDRTPPQVVVTRPAPDETVCGPAPPSFQATLTDLGALEGYRVLYARPGEPWQLLIRKPLDDGLPKQGPLREDLFDGPLAELDALAATWDGPLGLRVEAADLAGNLACGDVTVTVDGRFDAAAQVFPSAFSPNGDGVLDTLLLDLAVSEPATVDAQVFRGELRESDGVAFVVAAGPALRQLASALPVAAATQLSWDGRGDGGAPLADGPYVLDVRLSDACANRVTETLVATLDTEPPLVDLVAPPSGAQLGELLVALSGRVEDAGLAEWRVEVGAGDEPVTWSQVAFGRLIRRNEPLGEWNTFGLSGPYVLRLVAADRAGNAAAVSNYVEVAGGSELINELEAVPALVSPNGDGRQDEAAVRYGLLTGADVTLEVLTAAGELVRPLAFGETRPAGAAVVVWDGRDAAGQAVADGLYRVRLTASASASLQQTESVTVEVDATPPTVGLARPRDGFAAGSGPIVGTASDAHFDSFRLSLADDPAAPQWRQIGQGDLAVDGGALGDLGHLGEGTYALRLEAFDAAGNAAEVVVVFTVDDQAPRVTLAAPAAGEVLSAARGPVDVRGTVTEEHPRRFRVEYGAGASPAAWVELAAGDGLPGAGVLAAWNVTGLADGAYTLRLAAVDEGGLEGEARVPVTVNNTPPAVALTAPANGAWITGPIEIRGTASDGDFQSYRLELAPGPAASATAFVELARVASPVTAGLLLDWQGLPAADGLYTLRLTAWDRADNAASTAVEVRIDRAAPAPPAGVAAGLIDADSARVTWQANGETDLAGYRVRRQGAVVGSAGASAIGFTENGITVEGELVYTVVAFDQAGNESEPSAPASTIRDLTPPSTLVHQPRDGERLGGVVAVRITAFSDDDFKEYRLLADRGDSAPVLLRRATLPVEQQVFEWDTAGEPDGPVTLRLETEDTRGNAGVDEAPIVLDNTPPAAPTGLLAAAAGADVDLAWDANAESDLAGYLLFRDGALVAGDAAADLRPFALPAPAYADLGVADGEHLYRVAAIDGTGNVGALSAPAVVTLDERAPHAVIAEPVAGAATDGDLYVLATAEDLDVAQVDFEFRAAGDGAWTLFGSAAGRPFEATWDPGALGVAYGDYEVRAVATDEGGRVDPAPAPVPFVFKDLQRPAVVQGLAARVDGGEVTLIWQPVGDADLAGYHVERARDGGAPVRLTLEPVAATTFTDASAPDAELAYTVVAADVYDNEADPSAPVAVSVYTPQLTAPATPTPELTTDLDGVAVTTAGEPVADAAVRVVVAYAGGGAGEATGTTDAEGAFAVTGVPLERGDNTLRVTVTDGRGDRSRAAAATVLSVAPPSAPTGLAAVGSYPDVELTWNPNPEPAVVGYRVLHERFPAAGPIDPADITASASTEFFPAAYALEPSPTPGSIFWSPVIDADHPVDGQWWAASFAPAAVTAVEVAWRTLGAHAVDYDLQVLDGGDWRTVVEVRDNSLRVNRLELAAPAVTSGVRLLLHRIAATFLQLDLVTIETASLVVEPTWTDLGAGDGIHTYQVVAVDVYGFESPPSESVTVALGDAVPPDPPVLDAAVDGSDVALSWTASDAADLAHYELSRDGTLVALGLETAFVDSGRPNGTYAYVVRAVDAVGNRSASSNAAVVTVAVPVPAAPAGLTVTAPPAGGALALAWQPPPGAVPAAYAVRRSTAAGGPYETVATPATASYVDMGLTNGVTYFYVVAALDAVGNAGPPSAEASGVPERQVPGPALGYPGRPGDTVTAAASPLPRLAGLAETGLTVVVHRNGSEVGRVEPAPTTTSVTAGSSLQGVPRVSPDGRWVWGDTSSTTGRLQDFETGVFRFVSGIGGEVRWMPSSDRVVYGQSGVIRTYRVVDGAFADLFATGLIVTAAVPSPDGARFLALGTDLGTVNGLFVFDAATGGREQAVDAPLAAFDRQTLTWSPDGRRAAWIGQRRVEVLDLESGDLTTLADNLPTTGYGVAFSPAGDALAFDNTDTSGARQIWIHTFADGVTRALTSGFRDKQMPRWLPDGRLIYMENTSRIQIFEIDSGESTVLFSVSFWSPARLEVSAAGQVVVGRSGRFVRVTPAGYFELRDLALDPGDNLFTAQGVTAGGDASAETAPLNVRLGGDLPEPQLPDLEVTAADLATAPVYPVAGTAATVQVTVTNRGAEAGATDVDVLQIRPDGSSAVVATLAVPPLLPGERTTISGNAAFTGAAGTHTLVAVVDPRNRVAETSEDNNRAERPLLLLDAAAPRVFAATDAASYGAAEDVAIAVTVVNGGSEPFNGRLDVVIEDAAGFPVTTLAAIEPLALASGAATSYELTWNTGDVFAGTYRVRAVLAGGGTATEASAPFAVVSSVLLDADLVTNRTTYAEGATVRLTATVRYVEGTVVVPDVVTRVRVVDALGVVAAEWLRPLGDLLPGAENAVSLSWATAGKAPGRYRAELEVRRGDEVLAAAGTTFVLGELQGPRLAAAKTDALAVDADGDGQAGAGDVLRYEIVIASTGDDPVTGVTVHDLPPASTALVAGSVTASRGAVTSEDPVTVELGDLAPGEAATVAFEVTIADPLPAEVTEIVNQGTVTSAELPAVVTDDPDLGGDADPTATPVGGAPELAAEKTWTLAADADGDGVPSPGDTIAYTLVVRNTGAGTASGVVAVDPIPAHTALVPASAVTSQGTIESEEPLQVFFGELPPGAVATATFAVTVNAPIAAGVAEIVNQGLVSSDQLSDVATDDPGTGAPADPTVTPITAAPVLTVEKTAALFADADGDGLASPGDEVLYRVEVVNAGNTAATAVVLSDPLPAHAAVVAGSVQASQGTVTGDDPVAVDFGEVAVGTPALVTLRVTIDDPFPVDVLALVNQAAVASAELPPVASDDPATPAPGDATATPVFITPEVAVDDVTAAEAAGTAVFTVALSEPGNRAVRVAWSTSGASAVPGLDYLEAAGSVELAPGELTAEIAVEVLDDTLDEDDETFVVTLIAAEGAILGGAEAVATIADDDPPPVLTVADVEVVEGDPPAGAEAVFVLELAVPSGRAISVGFATADGTATASDLPVGGGDYVAAAGTAGFAPGETTAEVRVAVRPDLVDELDETFVLTLSEPLNVTLAASAATATIRDDDDALIAIDDVAVEEGLEDALFTVTLATLADREIRVDYATEDETAAVGADYLAAAGTLIFPAGSVSQTLAVPIVDDLVFEELDETFRVVLANAVGTVFADAVGVATIADDELCPGPNLLVNPSAERRELGGDVAGGRPAGWTLLEGDFRRRFAPPDPVDGQVTFFAGASAYSELYQDVDVGAYAARVAAGTQRFAFDGYVRTFDESPPDVVRVVVEYREAQNAVVLDAFDSGEITSPLEWTRLSDVRAAPVGTGWIRVRLLATRFAGADNDAFADALSLRSLRAPTLGIDDVTVFEGDAGTRDAVFTARLACVYEHPVSAGYATADGTAAAPEDYLSGSGALLFPVGATAQPIAVPVVGDRAAEPHETFFVGLADPSPSGIVTLAPGRGVIRDDDACPRSPGYWKTHVEEWPVDYLPLAGGEIEAEEMLALLEYGGPDAASKLARQLVATRLNLEVGSPLDDPDLDVPILQVVEEADAFLAVFPPGSKPGGDDKKIAEDLKDDLEHYNDLDCEDDHGDDDDDD